MSSSDLLDAALAWWKRGETPIPIMVGTKRPPVGFALKPLLDGRRPSQREVRTWWKQWPDAQVAIVLGRSLVAIDTDGPGAEAIISRMKVPKTVTQQTPRPGRHRLYWVDAPTRGRVVKAPDGSSLELRGLGQFILVAPSRHPSGAQYRWEVPPTEPLAPLPAAVLALFPSYQRQETAGAPGGEPPELPERWLCLLEKNPRTRAAWEGQGGHPDQSGSGKDLFLAHEVRRCGFGPEEARRVVLGAPWSVEGGRTEAYLSRTIARAYKAGHKRQLPAYGIIPASVVDDGTFARLSLPEKALLTILCVRRMRPSNTILRSIELLAKDLGVSPGQVGRIAAKLEDRGLIQRRRVAGARIVYHLPFFLPGLTGGVRDDAAETAPDQGPAPAQATRPPRGGKKEGATRPPMQGKPSLVMNGFSGPLRNPAPLGVSGGLEGGKEKTGAPTPPSFRFVLPEVLPDGTRVILRKLADGTEEEVFRGTLDEWVAWRPSESLGAAPLEAAGQIRPMGMNDVPLSTIRLVEGVDREPAQSVGAGTGA